MHKSSDFFRDIMRDDVLVPIRPSDDFSVYLVQRYLSGLSPQHCQLMNDLINVRFANWDDDQDVLDFLKIVIPKRRGAKLTFFKKSSSSNTPKPSVDIVGLSRSLEMSRKDIMEMIEYFPEVCEGLVDEKEVILTNK